MIAIGIVAAIIIVAVTLSSSAGSRNNQSSPTTSAPPATTSSLDDTSTCTDWQNASASDNQSYADANGGSISGTDVSQYLTLACSDFLSNSSSDPQIGELVTYLRVHGVTDTVPCNNDPNSTLPDC